jgi:hypothetical protein
MRVDTCALPVGATAISMASTSGNKEFWSEFLNVYRSLSVLWHAKSELHKNKNLQAER